MKSILGLTDFTECRQQKLLKEWQEKEQYRILPKIKLWEKIKYHFRRKEPVEVHKHKWALIREEQQGYINYRRGEKYGNFTLYLKAYKCKDCGEFKFWYSENMNDCDNFMKSKEDFEFNVINGIEER